MKRLRTILCIGILILTFIAMVANVVLAALDNSILAGDITGAATALCAIGWFLALWNLRLAEEGNFNHGSKPPVPGETPNGESAKPDDTPMTYGVEIPESERL